MLPEGAAPARVPRDWRTAIVGYASRVGTRPPKAQAIPIEELIDRLQRLADATGVERARLAAELSSTGGPTIVSIRAARDMGIWEATRQLSYVEVMAELDLKSKANISDAVTRHNRARKAGS